MLSHGSEIDVAMAVAGVLRWLTVVLGAYLAASVVASAVVHGLRLGGRATRLVDAVTLPPVRRLVQAAVGTFVTAGTFLAPAAAAAAGASADDQAVPVMRRLPEHAPEHVPDPAPAPPAVPVVPAPEPREWTVRPGDHFWSIAEQVLAAELHRAPTGAETDPYWRRLVTANHDRLADPGNPDLLFPGQVLLVAPTAPAPVG